MHTNEIVIVIFGIIYFLYILYTRRRSDFEEFSVARRSLGTFMIFATICASYIGPGWTMGLVRDSYSHGGFLLIIAPLGGLGMLLNGWIIAPRVRKKFQGSYSIGDIIAGEKSHNHKTVRILVGIISLVLLISISIVMSYAGGELINRVFGFSKFWSIALMTCVVMIYSTFGGIRATIQTDVFQFLNFAVIIPVLALLIVFNGQFSWGEYVHMTTESAKHTFSVLSVNAVLGLYLYWFISGAGLDAPILNRFLASKTPQVAQKATMRAGVFIGVWFILMLFIGSAGAYLHPELSDNDQVLLGIAEMYLPEVLYGVFVVVLIGVVMSTQDTLMNSGGVLFSEDILATLNPSFTDVQKLYYSRTFTVLIGLISIMAAVFLTSMLQALYVILSFYVPVMFPVTIISVLKNKFYWQSAVSGMLGGFLSYLFWEVFASTLAPSILIGILCSCLAYWLSDEIMRKSHHPEKVVY